MDRDSYKSLAEAYQTMYEAPGAGAVLGGAGRVLTNPQVIKQGGKVGGSLALQKLQNWPEYRQYRDDGLSEEEAAAKVASRLGLNVTGSILGSALGSTVGPAGGIGGGVVGGPALVALVDAIDNEKTQKQKQQQAGIVWDDKSGKYVVKAENLTQDRRESDEAFAERKKSGQAMADELNNVKGGPKPPTWLEYERRREKERAKEATDKERIKDRGEDAGSLGKSKDAAKVPNYTVGGIEYDGNTGRPINPPATAPQGQGSVDSDTPNDQGNQTLDDIINEPYSADQNIPDNKPGDVLGPDGKPLKPSTQKPEDSNNQAQQGATGSAVATANLTPMQQWAKNFPELAKRVKPGQAGYDEINSMNKPQPAQQQQSQAQPQRQRSGGLMGKLNDYQREHGYGNDTPTSSSRTPSNNTPTSSSTPSSDNDPVARRVNNAIDTVRNNSSRALGATRRGIDTVRNSRAAAAAKDAAGTVGNAVKDTAVDAARSQTGRTLIDQSRKAAGAINRGVRDALKPANQDD
jgi:hypothetical protein